MGSYIMLDNENALNSVNPFVIDGPGSWRKPYGFAPGVPDKDQVQCTNYGCSLPSNNTSLEKQSYIEKNVSESPWEPIEKTPLCSWGINAQTNGSLDAPSCRSPKNPEPCFMGRALEPTQEFIPDLYTQIPYRDPLPKQLQVVPGFEMKFEYIFLATALVALLVIAKQ
jgi:hypothetical protein